MNVNYSYHKVGVFKGKTPRIWLQGANLARANFTKDQRYTVTFDIDSREIILKVCDSNEAQCRIVSGRKKPNSDQSTPIIDLASNDLIDVTRGAKRIRADFKEDEIRISIHHMEVSQTERETKLKDSLAKGLLRKGVLCAGIGVSAFASFTGLKKQGFKARTEFIVDRERRYLDVAAANNPALHSQTQIFEASLEELEPHLLPEIDLLDFSLPCTGQSRAGKSKNKLSCAEEHATDATAIFGLMRIIDATQPAILTSENVVDAMNSATYILLKSMLNLCGYNVDEIVLDGSVTNSFENRRRYWFVATSKGLPRPNLQSFPNFPTNYQNLGELIEPIPHDHRAWKSTAAKEKKAAINKAKGNNFNFNLVTEECESIGVCGRFYQKDRGTEVHLAGPNKTMRLLTPREIAKAQEVPLELIANISDAVAYEGLGQGVDFRQAMGIAMIVGRDILERVAAPKEKVAANDHYVPMRQVALFS